MDKTITCRDCSQQFLFTAREQEFFAERGFGDPVRCLNCRREHKARKMAGQEGPAPGGSMERAGRPERFDRPFQSDRPQYNDRPQYGDRPFGGDRGRPADRPGGGERPAGPGAGPYRERPAGGGYPPREGARTDNWAPRPERSFETVPPSRPEGRQEYGGGGGREGDNWGSRDGAGKADAARKKEKRRPREQRYSEFDEDDY